MVGRDLVWRADRDVVLWRLERCVALCCVVLFANAGDMDSATRFTSAAGPLSDPLEEGDATTSEMNDEILGRQTLVVELRRRCCHVC